MIRQVMIIINVSSEAILRNTFGSVELNDISLASLKVHFL